MFHLFVFVLRRLLFFFFFFFNDTATTEIYTLSLHDALPISAIHAGVARGARRDLRGPARAHAAAPDRKSTRLNSSHLVISYAVFCLKKKKKTKLTRIVATEQVLSTLPMSYLGVYMTRHKYVQ